MNANSGSPGISLLDTFLHAIRSERTGAAYQIFETLIGRLLEEDLSPPQTMSPPSGQLGKSSRYEFDYVLPMGIREMPGPMVAEVKLFASHVSIGRFDDTIMRWQALNSQSREQGLHLLLIHTARLTSTQTARLRAQGDLKSGPGRLFIWGYDEVSTLFDRHPQTVANAMSDLSLLPVRVELSKPEQDWRLRRDQQIEQLRQTFNTDGASFVLGAGVSASAGLPDWQSILSTLYVKLISRARGVADIPQDEMVTIARAAQGFTEGSPLLSARYLRSGLQADDTDSDKALQEAVSSALYGGVPAGGESSPLIAEIARLAQPKRLGPRVQSVITYNFDDLLEIEFERVGIDHKSVFHGADHRDPQNLPVAHVHGFLPRDIDRYPDLNKGLLAFSEEGYHQLFKNSYHWSNIVQLNTFREENCILIGLSLTDPNLRRLLEIAAEDSDKPQHVAFMIRRTYDELARLAREKINPDTILDEPGAEAFLRAHHLLEEQVLRELGVEVLWYEKHEDVPELLKKLR